MKTPLISIVFFLLAALFGAVGQFLYKSGAERAGGSITGYLLNPRLLGGVVCYVAVMVLFGFTGEIVLNFINSAMSTVTCKDAVAALVICRSRKATIRGASRCARPKSNGEVEGPRRSARSSAAGAQVLPRPRRVTTSRSRTPANDC